MTALAALSALLPAEALALLVALGGFALIVGARRLATALLGLALAGALLPPLVAPLLDEIPAWLLALLAVYVALALLRAFLVVFIGGRASDHAIGHFVGTLLVGLFLLPFLLLRGGTSFLVAVIRRTLG